MSDNLPLLAAKDIGDVLYPRNIITDPSGADITPQSIIRLPISRPEEKTSPITTIRPSA